MEHKMRKEINKFKEFLNENSEEKLNISDVSDSLYQDGSTRNENGLLDKMRKLLFGTIVVLSTILTSCGTTAATEEKTTTEDSTAVETTTVTTPSVDSAKVEK